jgi:hypothetical protein
MNIKISIKIDKYLRMEGRRQIWQDRSKHCLLRESNQPPWSNHSSYQSNDTLPFCNQDRAMEIQFGSSRKA